MFSSARSRIVAAFTGGAVVIALTASGGVPAAQAGPASQHRESVTAVAAAKQVLSSDYGTAASRVVGTYGRAGTVKGWFTPRRFARHNGGLVAVGMLHGILVRPDGTTRGETDQRVSIPVKRVEGAPVGKLPTSCQVLNLVLGPLDLDLLGLHVHLNRVVLNIEAIPGPGNLLGNLLCAVAGLLDNTGVLTQIQQILNSILAILRL
jgi:hypothetical protein